MITSRDGAERWSEACSPESWDGSLPERWTIRGCSYGDYTGGAVEEANHRVVESALVGAGLPDGRWGEEAGAYGTWSLWIAVGDWELPEEVVNILVGLESYPVADEDLLCSIEHDREDEAWEEWGRGEWLSAVRDAFEARHGFAPDWSCDGDRAVSDLYLDAAGRANEYVVHETGWGVFFPVDRVIAKAGDWVLDTIAEHDDWIEVDPQEACWSTDTADTITVRREWEGGVWEYMVVSASWSPPAELLAAVRADEEGLQMPDGWTSVCGAGAGVVGPDNVWYTRGDWA